MVENPGAAQARLLLGALHEQVAAISHKIEKAERRDHRTSTRGAVHDRRQQSELRRDLYEAHRLIDGLHHRYPETLAARRGENARQVLPAARTRLPHRKLN
jgi:predicted  nucleic acid-binding Zn-ribbon protein